MAGDVHVCDQKFLSFGTIEISKAWYNYKTTPVVDARETVLRINPIWLPQAN